MVRIEEVLGGERSRDGRGSGRFIRVRMNWGVGREKG